MKLQILILALAAIFGMASGQCKFMGNAYAVGTTIMQSGCQQIVCKQKGRTFYWDSVDAPLDECDTCCVYNDPHITTFDRSDHYNWHGTCRYSLVEYLLACGREKNPQFAVYGDFKKCGRNSWRDPSCVDITSYQLSSDINDVLHVKHSNIFEIFNFDFSNSVYCKNANPTPIVIGMTEYEAFCWTENGCMNILGPDLLVTFCEHEVCITASEEYMCLLNGLCGLYNGDGSDDHTERDGTFHNWNNGVPAFATSWQVAPYAYDDEDCIPIKKEEEEKECNKEELMRYIEICREFLEGFTKNEELFNDILMACAEDLCAFPENIEKWMQIALQNGQEQNAFFFPDKPRE